MTQKTLEVTETLAHGYSSENSQQELSNGYKQDRVKMIIKTRLSIGILIFVTFSAIFLLSCVQPVVTEWRIMHGSFTSGIILKLYHETTQFQKCAEDC